MRNAIIVVTSLLLAFFAVPSFAAEHGGHNGGSHEGHAGIGMDISHAGHSREEHRDFVKRMPDEDHEYIQKVCKIPYKHRTPDEKVFCNNIND